MKLLDLLMKIEKYLPKGLRDKILSWVLKRKMKQVFELKTSPQVVSNHDRISETQFGQMLQDPEFLKAVQKLKETQNKINGTDKPM